MAEKGLWPGWQDASNRDVQAVRAIWSEDSKAESELMRREMHKVSRGR